MKKIILAAALIVTIGSAHANTFAPAKSNLFEITANNNAVIPQASVDAYKAMYPGATTIKWARKGENVYRVTFIYNGVKMTAGYNSTGVYLGK